MLVIESSCARPAVGYEGRPHVPTLAGPGPQTCFAAQAALQPRRRTHRKADTISHLQPVPTAHGSTSRPWCRSVALQVTPTTVASTELPEERGLETEPVVHNCSSLAACLGVSYDKVQRILRRYPVAAALSTAQLTEISLQLSEALSISPLAALVMVLKRPVLLNQHPEEVHELTDHVAAIVGMDPQDAASLIAQQPQILDHPLNSLEADLTRLAGALGVPLPGMLLILSRSNTAVLKQLLSSPGAVIIDQLLSLRSIIVQQCGPAQAPIVQLLVTRWPALLVTPPEMVADTLVAVGNMLKLSSGRLLSLFAKCPGILAMPALEVVTNFRGLLAALRINTAAVVDMCLAEPRLLQLDPHTIKSRLDAMMFELYLPRKQVLDMIVRQPQLLLYQSHTLQSHMISLMSILSVQQEVAQAMTQRYPNLLIFSPETLQAKLALLSRLFKLTPMHARELVTLQPRLLSFSSSRLSDSREVLSQVLGLEPLNMSCMVMVWPTLLLAPPNTVRGKVRDLAALLCIEDEQAGRLMRSNPSFISQDSRLWQTNFDSITSQSGLSLDQARDAIRLKPALLSQPPRKLFARCRAIARLAASHPSWWTAWYTATATDIVRYLMSTNQLVQHLDFLRVTGNQSQVGFFDPIITNEVAFKARFKQFNQAAVARRRQGQGAGRAAAAEWDGPKAAGPGGRQGRGRQQQQQEGDDDEDVMVEELISSMSSMDWMSS